MHFPGERLHRALDERYSKGHRTTAKNVLHTIEAFCPCECVLCPQAVCLPSRYLGYVETAR